MIAAHYPALQVVVPLVAAPVVAMIRQKDAAWLLAVLSSLACFVISLGLVAQVQQYGVISYEMGNWPPPWGIELRIDHLNVFVLSFLSGIATIVAIYARQSVAKEIPQDKQALFYTMFLLCFAGLAGITVTGDAFNLFVFLEVSSLSTYAMIAMGSKRQALVASYNYLILGTMGATFYVIAVGLIYGMTGTLNMAEMVTRLDPVKDSPTIIAAFAFITVGLGLKAAIFPLHLWLPNAYTYAPSVVSAFLAATATKVMIYALLRMVFTIFGADFKLEVPLANTYVILALGAMFVGSLVAIYQDDAKRLFAFSSVAQVGYMVLGISVGTVTGLSAGIMHLFNHAMMKSALFLALGAVMYKVGGTTMHALAGLGKRMPWTAAAMVAAGFSLAGVPFTAGFITKWTLVQAVIETDQAWLAAAIVISSLIGIIYFWRLIETMYLREPEPDITATGEAPLGLVLPVWVLVAANYFYGINAEYPVSMARAAAKALLGEGL